jgi:hypothetical protein
MPRRLRIKFRGNYALQLDKGSFVWTGKDVAVSPGLVAPELSERVQLGTGETGWQYASKGFRGLDMEWTTPTNTLGGTWLDSLGVQNGTAHYITTPTIPIGAVSVNIDISGIGGDIFCKGIEAGSRWGAWTVTIDGANADAFWLAQSNAGSGVAMGAGSSSTTNPFIVKNQNNGALMQLTWTVPLNATRTITCNLAIGPLIPPYPLVINTNLTGPNIHECDMVDYATLLAFFSTGNSQGVTGSDGSTDLSFLTHSKGSFGIDPDNGLKYARFCIPTVRLDGAPNRRGIAWWKELPPELEEAWFQYSGFFESSVWDGINPNEACKFGGSPTEEVPWNGSDSHHFAWRPLHGGKSVANPHVFSFGELRESFGVVPFNTVKNACIRANKWYLFDTYIKLNTIDPGTGLGNFDGEGRLYINKNLVHSFTGWRWRNSQFAPDGHERTILAHYFNYFHGGNEWEPIEDMFYRIARLRASTTEIAVPPELSAALSFPTWRQGLPVEQVATISGTSGAGVIPVNAHALHWNGLAITDDGRVVGCASGGHNSDNVQGSNGQNKCFGIDLSEDVPGPWTVLHAGTSAANAPDWDATEVGGALASFYASKPYRAHYPADVGDVAIRPSAQTYFGLQYVKGAHCNDGHERIFNVVLRSPRSGLGGTHSRRQVDGFKLTTNQWDEPEADTTPYPFAGNGTKWADLLPRNGQSTSSANETQIPNVCTDPRNGKIYYSTEFSLFIFNPQLTTNQWSTGITANGVTGIYTHAGSGWAGAQGRGMLVDVNRERLVIVDPTGGNFPPGAGLRLAHFPLAGGAIQFTTVTGITQGARVHYINFDCGFTHDLDNDRYLLLLSSAGTGSIDYWWAINPTTGAASLVHESAAGAGGPGRCMTSFKYVDALGGVVYAQGGNTAALAEEMPIKFLPTRSSP